MSPHPGQQMLMLRHCHSCGYIETNSSDWIKTPRRDDASRLHSSRPGLRHFTAATRQGHPQSSRISIQHGHVIISCISRSPPPRAWAALTQPRSPSTAPGKRGDHTHSTGLPWHLGKTRHHRERTDEFRKRVRVRQQSATDPITVVRTDMWKKWWRGST